MPHEIQDVASFTELASKAEVCRVLRTNGQVKLKLRTKKGLYTLSTDSAEADSLLKNLKCQVVELTKQKKKASKEAKEDKKEEEDEEESSTPREKQAEE